MSKMAIEQAESAAVGRRWPWALVIVPALALLPLVWRFIDHSAAVLDFPWQIDYDEGIVLHAAWIVARGDNPYHPLRPDAFTSATYPPFYYLLNAIWMKLSGPTLLSGRLLSLAATLAAGAILGWWTWLESRAWPAGALAAALWLSLSPVYVWGSLYKPDLLALCLTLAGLAAARRWATWPALTLAILLFVLAFFTKQSALVGPLAVGLWLLARRGPWLRFGLATGGLLAALLAAGNLLLHGGLWLHIVVFQREIPWSVGQLEHNLSKLWATYPWLLGAGGLALVWLMAGKLWSRWREEDSALRGERQAASLRPFGAVRSVLSTQYSALDFLPIWYLLAAVPAVLLANGRAGVNYGLLLDLFPPLCLLVGAAAGELARGQGWPRLALGGLLGGLIVVQAVVPNSPDEWYSANRMPSPERAHRMQIIADIVAQTPGRILSEDLWLLLRAGKPVEYDDPFMMAQTAGSGLWDERRFVGDLEAQRFALVLLEYEITDVPRSPRWSPAALAALRANYEILHRDVIFIHRPKSLQQAAGTAQNIVYGDQLRLLETAVSTTSTRPGGTVRLMVHWERAGRPTADYKMFIHLLDPAGGVRAQVDVPPGPKPTSAWGEREQAEAEYPLTLPTDAPAGDYRIVVGLYDPATQQRLPATRAGAPAGDAVPVAAVRVGV